MLWGCRGEGEVVEGGGARHLSGLRGRAWGSYTREQPHGGSRQPKGGHPQLLRKPPGSLLWELTSIRGTGRGVGLTNVSS